MLRAVLRRTLSTVKERIVESSTFMVRMVESSTVMDRIVESSTRCGSYKLLDNCCRDSEECNRTRVCDF